jgi:hypothetical protein
VVVVDTEVLVVWLELVVLDVVVVVTVWANAGDVSATSTTAPASRQRLGAFDGTRPG